MHQVDFSELDDAAVRVLVADPSHRSAWARRFAWKIDRTLEYARKSQRTDSPAGILAKAAVSLFEAQELPPDSTWLLSEKRDEASRLIAAALALIGARES